MEIIVRREKESDYREVEVLTRAAFSYPGRSEHGGAGCPFEHWMVHSLREKDGIPELSYVAEAEGRLVGHIIYSNAWVEASAGGRVPVLNFGPLSVRPEYQRRGVGKALMQKTITRARELGYGAILFFGRPEYYPQFGFVEAAAFGITDRSGKNYPAFMAMELKPGYLRGIHGKYYESPIYDDRLNVEAVKKFDKSFLKHDMTRIGVKKEIQGTILDLGGGGEGIIGRVYGPQVTAIDNRQEELDEAPNGPRKLLMDAGTLSFADCTFDNATAFYFFMYLDKDARLSVMREAYRVLKPGGRFYVWDADMETADPFLVELDIDAGGAEIHTTYGIYKKDPEQDAGIIATAARRAGFRLIGQTEAEGQFVLFLEKAGGKGRI